MNKFTCTLLLVSLCLLSCDSKKQAEKSRTGKQDTTFNSGSNVELNEPKTALEFSVNDTASLKCYINTYTLPYTVKIFNSSYAVAEKDLSAFIASQKNELQKYRVHILTTAKNDHKKLTELNGMLSANNIIDFEIVEDGKASR